MCVLSVCVCLVCVHVRVLIMHVCLSCVCVRVLSEISVLSVLNLCAGLCLCLVCVYVISVCVCYVILCA